MGFEVKSIGEVCSVGDGAHSKVTRVETGIPYLTSKNIGQGFLKLDKLDYISEESFEKLFSKDSKATRRPQAGDVLFGIIGSFGNTYLYKESDFFGFSSSIGILRPNPELLDSEYLYYVVSSKKFRDNHANHNSGSVQGYTNIPTVKGLPVPVPSIAVQKKIAKVLQSLDRKIAVNQQTNQTLEAMAQAIFKSWFVDFDPVKAKMRGEQPEGMDEATASLFPDKLVESELGLIPDGWRASPLEDLVEIASSKRIFAKEYQEDGVPFFRGKEITELSKGNSVNPEIYITEERYQELKDKAGAPKENDILITSVGTIGNTYLVDSEDKFYFKDGNLTWVKDYKEEIIPYFLMEWFKSSVGKYAIENIKIGSTQQAITIKSLNGIKLVAPSRAIHEKFTQIVEPLYKKHRANIKQNKALSTLRDTLLPKLLSGEIELVEQS